MFSWCIDSWELQYCRIGSIISKVYLFSVVPFMEVVVVDIRLHHGHLWVLSSELAISVSSTGNHLLSFTLSPPHTQTAAHDLSLQLLLVLPGLLVKSLQNGCHSDWLYCHLVSFCSVYTALSYLVTVVLFVKYYCLHVSLHGITPYGCYGQCSVCTFYVAIKI